MKLTIKERKQLFANLSRDIPVLADYFRKRLPDGYSIMLDLYQGHVNIELWCDGEPVDAWPWDKLRAEKQCAKVIGISKRAKVE